MLRDYLDIKDEVKSALEMGKPVVALESTIISHGMPYPRNIETALKVEEIVRSGGAVPATVAVLHGRLKVGLVEDEIEYMGKSRGIVKASRRDIPFLLAKKMDGATTVAATMLIAAMAGIKIFVTGGIGGVHRGAQQTFDISADLEELAHTNIAVICAGAKSILDIGLTLEYLETRGVPVVGYKTDEFPAFYTRRSGFNVDYRVDSSRELALALKLKWGLGLDGGVVVANPIPLQYEMDYDKINSAIKNALAEADEKGVKGKDVTPFLLSKIKDITGGDSLESNIRLVYNNAAVGAELALELSRLQTL